MVSGLKIVEIERIQPSCCTIIFVIYGVNAKYKWGTKSIRFSVCFYWLPVSYKMHIIVQIYSNQVYMSCVTKTASFPCELT